MITPTFLNTSGLVVSAFGAFVMFYFSPANVGINYVYKSEESEARIRRANFKNKMMRLGMFLIFLGFMLQLVSMLK